VDHFKCYRVKKPKGFQPITAVPVVDQLAQPKLYDLKKPATLCAPVDKEGEGIKEEESFLVCYRAKPAKDEPKHTAVEGVYLENAFGPERVDTKVESTLCVPTLVVQGCGDGLVNEPGEQCDDGNESDGDGCSSSCQSELPLTIEIANLNILQNITVGNVGYDDLSDRVTLLADEIAAVQPDIATFQEVVLGVAMDQLIDDLSTRYGLTYFSAEYGVLSGNALISRWPATTEEVILIPDLDLVPSFPDRRFTGRVRVDSPVGALDVYPMHLCAFCSMAERGVQTQAFIDFVNATHTSGHPAIVGADFNAHTGTAPDGDPANDPPIDAMQGEGWVSLFDGFDAPCAAPADRSGCTRGIDDLTDPVDTTERRIDNIMVVPASAPPFSGAISTATEIGPTSRFAASPLVDPNAECHFEPRILCAGPTCPAGSTCHPNGFCVRSAPIDCSNNADCPDDIAPENCRTTLWVSDHLGVQSTIQLDPVP
jgi:cysteine-rich repeat protein